MVKSISFIFGKMNPPKEAHLHLLKSLSKTNKDVHAIVLGATDETYASAKEFFKGFSVKNLKTNTLSDTIDQLKSLGYDDINIGIGEHKAENFKALQKDGVKFTSTKVPEESLKEPSKDEKASGNSRNFRKHSIKSNYNKKPNKSGIDDSHDKIIIQYKLKNDRRVIQTKKFASRREAINYYEQNLEGKTSKVVFSNTTKKIYYDLNYNEAESLLTGVKEVYSDKVNKWIDNNIEDYKSRYGELYENKLFETADYLQKTALNVVSPPQKIFVALYPTDETQQNLKSWCRFQGYDLLKDHNENLTDNFEFHITLIFGISNKITTSDLNILKLPVFTFIPESYDLFGIEKNIPVLKITKNEELVDFRNAILRNMCIQDSSEFPFTPHISLSYSRNKILPKEFPYFPLEFDKIKYSLFDDNNSKN